MRGVNKLEKKELVKLVLGKWKADIVCLTETKMKKINLDCIRLIGGSRWTEWIEMEAQGNSGGIVIFWDKRRWKCLEHIKGQHSVTILLEEEKSGYQYAFTGVYGPCDRKERKGLWKELAAINGIMAQLWAVGGDFNVIRFEEEKRGRAKNTRAMRVLKIYS